MVRCRATSARPAALDHPKKSLRQPSPVGLGVACPSGDLDGRALLGWSSAAGFDVAGASPPLADRALGRPESPGGDSLQVAPPALNCARWGGACFGGGGETATLREAFALPRLALLTGSPRWNLRQTRKFITHN